MIKWGKAKEPSVVLSWREDVTVAKELLYPKRSYKAAGGRT